MIPIQKAVGSIPIRRAIYIMIRKAELKDIEAIKQLLYQVQYLHASGRPDIFKKGTKKFTDGELKEILTGKGLTFFVYEKEERILGYVCVQLIDEKETASRHKRRQLYIEDLCVDERYRNRGIGSKLFEYVSKLAIKKDCDCLTLNVWELNEEARRFYESKGMFPLKTIMEKIM